MPTIKQIFSPFFCCLGFQSCHENQTTSDLPTQPSTLSIPLPSSTIPHVDGRSESQTADTDALRQIFRSSSSIRGYQTAALKPGPSLERQSSFDANFKFGSQGPERKHPSRFEQLGTHIKQKLSESKLSKSSSKHHVSEADNLHSKQNDASALGRENAEATLSQRSTELLDLLMSRTGSEGGYDSDARSIQTTALKGSDGTMCLSPRDAHKVVESTTQPAIATDGAPPSPKCSQNVVKGVGLSLGVDQSPSIPSDASFAKALLAEKNESPTTTLKRLSVGIANGSIRLPDTVEISTNSIPLDSAMRHRSVAADSQLTKFHDQQDPEFMGAMKRLSGTVAVAKRASLISEADDPRTSLVSHLDPTLIDFISKFGDRNSIESARNLFDENTPPHQVESRATPLERLDSYGVLKSKYNELSKRDLASLAESDRSSVHLYNMRISQRLASPSFVAASSRPNTSHSSLHQPTTNRFEGSATTRHTSDVGRNPGFNAVEHNRRPSDPQTRRLFEDETASEGSRPWRIPVVPIDGAWCPTHAKPRDETSSFYWSDGEVDDSKGGNPHVFRRNRNSIAVGGRSESISLPIGSCNASMSHISFAEESAWFSRKSSQHRRESIGDRLILGNTQRGRSVSLPNGNNAQLQRLTPIHGRRPGYSTEVNEAMSEISVGPLQDARREQLTEISAQAVRDVHNERMSEVDPPDWRDVLRRERSSSVNHPSSWSKGAEVSELTLRERLRNLRSSENGTRDNEGVRPLQETATDLWQRSFQRAVQESEEQSLGGFLTFPKFDSHGRRRSTRSSISAVQSSNHESVGPTPELDPQRILTNQCQHQTSNATEWPQGRICMKKPELLPVVNPRRTSATLDGKKDGLKSSTERKASRKKSVLDVGRRFTTIGSFRDEERFSGVSAPLKDRLGLWGRFPSHTRAERVGCAGAEDGVIVRDFALEQQNKNNPSDSTPPTPWTISAVASSFHSSGSWRRLPTRMKDRIDKSKSRSMTLPRNGTAGHSPAIRVKKSGKGLVGRWKKLYRSSSSDLRAYTRTYGHRSSISVGASVEYPDLEVVPGNDYLRYHGLRRSRSAIVDGAGELEPHRHQPEKAARTHNLYQGEQLQVETLPWTRRYESCVGSLSALKSENELGRMSLDEHAGLQDARSGDICSLKSDDLRHSTVDFEAQLEKEEEAVREGLIRKIENMGHEAQPEVGDESKIKH